ncbi:unnamed protein product [Linum trigynum]|uniref:BAG domain-containing protein n=1 Tax=Linum trigynum TaxID=586398 RepID=A0AAV2DAZ5_9ROSI
MRGTNLRSRSELHQHETSKTKSNPSLGQKKDDQNTSDLSPKLVPSSIVPSMLTSPPESSSKTASVHASPIHPHFWMKHVDVDGGPERSKQTDELGTLKDLLEKTSTQIGDLAGAKASPRGDRKIIITKMEEILKWIINSKRAAPAA